MLKNESFLTAAELKHKVSRTVKQTITNAPIIRTAKDRFEYNFRRSKSHRRACFLVTSGK